MTVSGNGYWLVTANGAVFSFGDAPSGGGQRPAGPGLGHRAQPGRAGSLLARTGCLLLRCSLRGKHRWHRLVLGADLRKWRSCRLRQGVGLGRLRSAEASSNLRRTRRSGGSGRAVAATSWPTWASALSGGRRARSEGRGGGSRPRGRVMLERRPYRDREHEQGLGADRSLRRRPPDVPGAGGDQDDGREADPGPSRGRGSARSCRRPGRLLPRGNPAHRTSAFDVGDETSTRPG